MMFKNMKVGTRLIAGFLLISIVGAIVGALGIRAMDALNSKATDLYQKELLGVAYTKEANINLIYVGRAVSNMLLATSDAERARFAAIVDEALRGLRENAEKAKPLFYTENGQKKFAEFERKLSEYQALIPVLKQRVGEQSLHEDNEAIRYFFTTFRSKADEIDDAMTALSAVKARNAKDADDLTNEIYSKNRMSLLILVVGGAVVGVLLGLFISRSITRPLLSAVDVARTVATGDLSSRIEVQSSDELGQLLQALKTMNDSLVKIVGEVRAGTETIGAASGQIASGNADLSSRTEEQASSLEETASSMEELTSTVKQNADNARQANQLAVSASAVAERGGEVVDQVITTMSSIHDSSRKVVDIISVIDGIAFQTNILALNAAVEAARAGEQGRGFAVVASEVRNLAQRSAAAAKEIKTLIDSSVSSVEAGSALVSQAGMTMTEIVESVRRVTDIMGEITAATQEQTAGIEQINVAISQMDEVTQQNASLVEEAAAASEAMQEQAVHLARAVSTFKLGSEQHARVALAAGAAGKRAGTRPVAAVKRHPAAAPAHSRREPAATATDWEEF